MQFLEGRTAKRRDRFCYIRLLGLRLRRAQRWRHPLVYQGFVSSATSEEANAAADDGDGDADATADGDDLLLLFARR